MARPRQVSDDEILEAARAALLEEGPSVSVAAIGRRLGVSGPAVLQRMGGREALVTRALCLDGRPAFLEALERGAEGPTREALVDALVSTAAFFEEVVPRLLVARAGGLDLARLQPGDGPPPPVVVRALVARWLAGLGDPARAVGRAEALVGALEARGFQAWLQPGHAPPLRAWVLTLVDAVLPAP